MINPSAPGWIDKFFQEQRTDEPVAVLTDRFYERARATGLLYGHVISFDTPLPISNKGWTQEENSKLGLLITLYHTYGLVTGQFEKEDFVGKAMTFYRDIHPQGGNILKKMLPESPESWELEEMIDLRVQTNHDIISRNFSNILTNALLFQDVLAFRRYLLGDISPNYLKRLEETITGVVTLALNVKTSKSEYDQLLVRMFEASLRYTKFSKAATGDLQDLDFTFFTSEIERYYLFDMAVLAMWSDAVTEPAETDFLFRLAKRLGLGEDFRDESIASADVFIRNYRKEIPYFNYSNPVKHFYDQASQTVMLLISRNKNRLLKELANNAELMLLLTHSTHRSLDAKEKKKIRKQLLEVCKTVPSLAIFLLPGGSLLLPLLVKFIPKMLPTAFNENLDET